MKPQDRKASWALVALAAALTACAPEAARDEVRILDTPAAEGASAPRLSTAPDGSVVLSWVEPEGTGHALRFARLEGQRWSAPQTVTSGEGWFVNWADLPSVVPLSRDLWGAHWLAGREGGGPYAYDIRVAISTDAGETWSSAVTPHTDRTDTQHGFLSMFADNDGIGMVWLDGRKYINEVTEDVVASGMTLRAATVDKDGALHNEALIDELICDCCQTDVAMTPQGPVAVYRDRTVEEIRDIYVTRRMNGAWQPGRAVYHDGWKIEGCPVNGPVIEADGERVAVAWFTVAGGRPRVYTAWSIDAGQTFAPPIEIAAGQSVGYVGAALLPDGDLAVSWQRSQGGSNPQLALRRVSPSGELSDVRIIAEAADIFRFSVPQLVRRDDELVIAWTTEVNGAFHVRSAILSADAL